MPMLDVSPYIDTHLRPQQAAVRVYMQQHAPKDWPLFAKILATTTQSPLGPMSILPLAACAAVGGQPHTAVPAAAAWEAANIAMRILDNAQDDDKQGTLRAQFGWERAVNVSTGFSVWIFELLSHAEWPAGKSRQIIKEFSHAGLQLLAGQDNDLENLPRDLEESWGLMAAKDGAAFSLACVAGGYCGDAEYGEMRCLRAYGLHLGILLQVFDDLEGIWFPEGKSDLERGKVTFPLVHGLLGNHAGKGELQEIVASGQLAAKAARAKELLDAAGTRDFLLWTAQQERTRAISFLDQLPPTSGTQVLRAYLESIFSQAQAMRK